MSAVADELARLRADLDRTTAELRELQHYVAQHYENATHADVERWQNMSRQMCDRMGQLAREVRRLEKRAGES